VAAARRAGFIATGFHEAQVDAEFVRPKPGWEAHRGLTFTQASIWTPG
jgi:hypothetical protein